VVGKGKNELPQIENEIDLYRLNLRNRALSKALKMDGVVTVLKKFKPLNICHDY
jgi:hypothetical protein